MKTTLAGEVFIGTQIDDGWSSLALSPSLYANGLYTLVSPPSIPSWNNKQEYRNILKIKTTNAVWAAAAVDGAWSFCWNV